MATYIVTGSAGFIGSHLVSALLRRGDYVIGVDSFADFYPREWKESNMTSFRDDTRFRHVTIDLAAEPLDRLVADVSGIFHLAAQPGVRGSWGDSFWIYARDNVVASQRVFEAAAHASVKVVFASSSSIYGDAASYPTPEDVWPKPISPYGVTKLSCEQLAQAYAVNLGLRVVALRYFTVYGPRQRPDMAFSRLIEALFAHEEFTILGDGHQSRDFTYVDDAVSATLLAMDSAEPGTALNVGGGSEVSLLEAIAVIESLTGKRLRSRITARAVGDVSRTSADTRRINRGLGWSPQVSLEQGIASQVEWAVERIGHSRRS
jgi:UDP-glucuronate 4-epimerase